MRVKTMQKLNNTDSLYLKDSRGTVVPLFGLIVIPMLAITGAAIDIGQAISAERTLQSAIDSAALAVCSASPNEDPNDVVKAFLAAGLTGSRMQLTDGTTAAASGKFPVQLTQVGFNADENSVNPIATAAMPTSLLRLSGIADITINGQAKVRCGAKDLELSMVLDVTGSMNSFAGGKRKIDSLKDAGLDVISIFERNMTAGATRVALVPFSEAVNVGDVASKVRSQTKTTSIRPTRSPIAFPNAWAGRPGPARPRRVRERTARIQSGSCTLPTVSAGRRMSSCRFRVVPRL